MGFDLEYVIYGFAGTDDMFTAFDSWIYADVNRSATTNARYTYRTVVPRLSSIVKKLNSFVSPDNSLVVLVAIHFPESQLYHIPTSGDHKQLNYAAIGSGSSITDEHLLGLPLQTLTMKVFTVETCALIRHIEEIDKKLPFERRLGVGFGTSDPMIRWLQNGEKWDREPTCEELNDIAKKTAMKLVDYIQKKCHMI